MLCCECAISFNFVLALGFVYISYRRREEALMKRLMITNFFPDSSFRGKIYQCNTDAGENWKRRRLVRLFQGNDFAFRRVLIN